MTQTTMSSMTMRASARAARCGRRERRDARTRPGGRGRATVTRAGEVQKMNAEELEIAMANRETPMVIDFYATWCGPCVLMSSELEKVQERPGTRCGRPRWTRTRRRIWRRSCRFKVYRRSCSCPRISPSRRFARGMLPAETVVSDVA